MNLLSIVAASVLTVTALPLSPATPVDEKEEQAAAQVKRMGGGSNVTRQPRAGR